MRVDKRKLTSKRLNESFLNSHGLVQTRSFDEKRRKLDIGEQSFKFNRSSKTSVKSSRKCFVHLNWIRLANNPSWLDSSIGKAAV